MKRRGWVVFWFGMGVSSLAAAQSDQTPGRPGEIKTYQLTAPAPAGEKGKPAAPMGVKSIVSRPEAIADENLEAAIATLNQLIETTDDNDPSKPEYLSRLADLYWDKAESFFNKAYGNEMFARLRAAQEAGDEAGVAAVEADQKALIQQRTFWQEQAVTAYRSIVDGYPEYPALDSVLYYLGFALVQMDRPADAYPYFARIIRETPNSSFVPDALLNVAEFYFNAGRMDEALRVYGEVENFPASGAYGLAIYKKGWCYYNMGQHDEAMNQFLKVIDYSRSDAARAIGYGAQLMREAQRDLVMVYSQVGSPDNAIKVFRKISPDGYMELAIRLAEGYASQGEYDKSSRLYKRIIAEFKDREDAYRVIEFQRAILENAYRVGVVVRVVEEARRLVGLLDRFGPNAPEAFWKPERARCEEVLRVIATTYHKEVAVTKDEKTMAYTAELYDQYLRLFPDSPERVPMTLNHALLLAQVGKHGEAAEEFSQLIALDPHGEHAETAAHEAVANYYKMLDMSRRRVKSEDTADLEPKELPEFEKKLVEACNRYLAMAKPDAPDVVEARFAAAMVLYEYNHFQEAATRFREVIETAPDHPNAPDAARLLLSSLHLMRDIKGLNAAAEQISQNPKLMQGDVPVLVTRIREQADFNKCYEHEQQERHRTAAECFLDYVRRFPNTPLKDRALINAANNFFKARMVERSLEANTQLFNEMPKSPLAPKALFNVGEIYRRLAVYSEAARFYEIFVKMLPKHELTEEALRYATVFRSGLGEYDAAVADMNQYLKRFPSSEHAPSVFLEIGLVLAKQGKHAAAIKQFQAFLTKYGRGAGPDLYLRALLAVAQSHRAVKNDKAAQAAYNRVVEEYNALPDAEKEKVTAAGLAAAAEARFMQGEAILAEVRAIAIKGTQDEIAKAIRKKAELLKTAMDVFASVEAFGQPHWTIAAFSRKGFGFQELALAIEAVPPPRNFNEEQKEIFRGKLLEEAQPAWDRAKAEFRRCVETARQLKWYNEFSMQAEEAMMKLEPEFKSLPDIRPMPGYYSLNVGRPRLLPIREGEELPRYKDAGLEERVRAAAEGPNATAAAMYDHGAILEAKGDLDGARTWYERAAAADPKLADAVARLGSIALARGDTAEAVAKFERAMQIDPANSVAHNYLAAKEIRARNFPEAINHARMALVSDPDSMDAYLNLAATYLEMNLLDVGILVGRNAIGLDPDDAPIQNILGLILARRGEVRQAVSLYEKAVEDDPKSYDARMNLGATMLGYKDFESAARQFEAVLSMRPDDVQARLGFAVALRGLDRAKEAIAELNKVQTSRPDLADVHFNLCLVYQENLSDYAKALAECEAFARMAGPSHSKAEQVQKRIEGLRAILEAQGSGSAGPQ